MQAEASDQLARIEAKAAKAVLGTKGRFEGKVIFKTERAAEIRMVQHLVDGMWYDHLKDTGPDKAQDIAEALVAKTGEKLYDLLDRATRKAAKKYAKDQRESAKQAKRLGLA